MDNNVQSLAILSPEQALSTLESSEQGLTDTEVKKRRAEYGLNEIVKKSYRSVFMEAISHATNPLVGILLFAAIVSGFTGSMVNAIIIIVIVAMSVSLDYIQSHRSLIAVKHLQEQVAATANVLRNGNWTEILCSELVPGDIIRLVAGDMVPADALLLHAKDLHIQQAALTGESLPVEKEVTQSATPPKDISEIINAVFAGSSVVSGTATALIVSIGKNTLFGQIAQTLSESPPSTEFDKGILRFGFFIMKTVIFMSLFVFIVNICLHRGAIESLLFSIALAVGLTPELLPMITTVTLASGAVRMARKKVIVKNLSAIQNIGSMDILCSDKTGTLTSGEMLLDQYIDLSRNKSEYVLLLAYLNSLFGTEYVNQFNIAIQNKTNINPLDAAILKHDHPDAVAYKKIDEIPFDFERRRSSVIVDKNGTHLLITKGAPESIIDLCTSYDVNGSTQVLDNQTRDQFAAIYKSLSSDGYRVLAIAYRNMETQSAYHTSDEKDLILAGFLAFIDPPLPDVAETIQELQRVGVTIKILTGDNELVASHVCKQVGLDPGKIILGNDMDRMSAPALANIAEQTQIFARISPAQKQRIIAALRSRTHVSWLHW